MLHPLKRACFCILPLVLLTSFAKGAAEYQWSVAVPALKGSSETPQAFLWVPPNCSHVRAVIFAQHNMQEQPILENASFRQALADLDFAEVWVAPTFDGMFRFDQGAGEKFDAMMKSLADESGYRELAYAPIVPIGHSAAAMLPEYFAAWKPQRTLAWLSISGQWPFVPNKDAPQVEGRPIDGVPGLVTIGEYEWAEERIPVGTKTRADHPNVPMTMLACPADGHFESTDEKIQFLILYLKKAAQFRLPQDSPIDRAPDLKPIDPTKTGWLVAGWHANKDPAFPAAPVAQYTGDPANAFWCFDEETAHAIEAFQSRHRGKPDLLGYLQNGQVVPQNSKTHQQVTLKFLPDSDGIKFKLVGTFLDTVPEGRPTRWAGQTKDSPISHASDSSPIVITPICGPVKQLSADTFTLDLNRDSIVNDRRGNEIWFVAIHPGDDQYKRAVQQSKMDVPRRNTEGTEQHITFPKIDDVPTGTTEIKLGATSDSHLPVHYFVFSGPAEVEGDTLKLSPIPPRAQDKAVKIIVVAWQWGQTSDPKFQSAQPVEQTFSVLPARPASVDGEPTQPAGRSSVSETLK